MNISLFPKLWKIPNVNTLGSFLKNLGISFLELPVRPGYCVTKDNMETTLVSTVTQLRDRDISVHAVSWDPLEIPSQKLIELCGEANISTIRMMAKIDMNMGYMQSVTKLQKEIETILPYLEKQKVRLGIQNHADYWVGSALGLHHLLRPFPTQTCGAILDFAHCALGGEPIDMAWDIIEDYIIHVNFKSPCYYNYSNTKTADWKQMWVAHNQSLFSWSDTISFLKEKKYNKPIVLFAEYTEYVNGKKAEIIDEEATLLVKKDIDFLKEQIK